MNDHGDVASILLQLACLLGVARCLGEIAKRYGQPAVVGELLAGVFLGRAGLGSLGVSWFYDTSIVVSHSLAAFSLLGLILLLLLTGLETDIALIRRNARSALLVSVGGLLLPLVSGYLLGVVVPPHYAGSPDKAYMLPAFLAVCMGISALPVIGKVLIELNVTRRTVAQTLIAAAMFEDAVGWVILSVIIAVVESGEFSLWQVASAFGLVAGFVLGSLLLGRRLITWAIRSARQSVHAESVTLSIVIIGALIWAAMAQFLGLESVFGAFVFGIILGLVPSFDNKVAHTLHNVTLDIFAPIFFALAGLRVDPGAALSGNSVYITLTILVVAVACKSVGGYLGARFLAGMPPSAGVFIGLGLNARGSMEVIVATIGLKLGIFSGEIFSAIVIMAIITSLMAPPALRWAMARVPVGPDEAERLARERLQKESLVANINRVLVLIRLRSDESATPIHMIEAYIVDRLASYGRELNVTLLSVVGADEEMAAARYLESISLLFHGCRISWKVVISAAPGDAILEEASRNYDLLLMGTPQAQGTHQQVFTPLIDYLARMSPCPVVFVRTPAKGNMLSKFTNILVPTNGSQASVRAADFAFALTEHKSINSQGSEAMVTLLKIVERDNYTFSAAIEERQRQFALEHVAKLRSVGSLVGANVVGAVDVNPAPEQAILEFANNNNVDLIIIGASARAGAERLFLGARVERILEGTSCAALVVNTIQ